MYLNYDFKTNTISLSKLAIGVDAIGFNLSLRNNKTFTMYLNTAPRQDFHINIDFAFSNGVRFIDLTRPFLDMVTIGLVFGSRKNYKCYNLNEKHILLKDLTLDLRQIILKKRINGIHN